HGVPLENTQSRLGGGGFFFHVMQFLCDSKNPVPGFSGDTQSVIVIQNAGDGCGRNVCFFCNLFYCCHKVFLSFFPESKLFWNHYNKEAEEKEDKLIPVY